MIRIPVTIPGSIAITVSITLFGVITSLSVAGYTSIVCVRGGRNRDEVTSALASWHLTALWLKPNQS
jgi:hypothetical protein